MQNKQNADKETLLHRIHTKLFQHIGFSEIDYIAGQPLPGMIPQDDDIGQLFFVADHCLVVTEKAYDLLYGFLLNAVVCCPEGVGNVAAEVLLVMNGENDKAYNLKKTLLKKAYQELSETNEIISIDLAQELALNSAIIMRNKKSTACYEYRFLLLQLKLSQIKSQFKHQQDQQIYSDASRYREQLEFQLSSQQKFIKQVLNRYFRNYFCWMYRLRIFKLILALMQQLQSQQQRKLGISQLMEREAENVHQMLQTNPNDYSAVSYFRFIIKMWGNSFGDLPQLWVCRCKELVLFCQFAYEKQEQYKGILELTQFLTSMPHN